MNEVAMRIMIVGLVCTLSASLHADSPAVYDTDMTGAQFQARDAQELANGNLVVDIEMRWNGSQILYSAVWYPVQGAAIYAVAGVDVTTFEDFIDDMIPKNGRWLDLEVAYFGGQKRWAGIFMEDGDNYGFSLWSTTTDAEFQQAMYDNLRAGLQIIDFEAYEEGGQTNYAGLWVSDPNQPRTSLYYDLTSAELSDLINPQYPVDPVSGVTPLGGLCGRIIDIELYYSQVADGYRYAAIFAMHPGHEWAVQFNQPLGDLDADNAAYSDDNTHLVDLDVYEIGGELKYIGIWGDDYKSRLEVDAIPAEEDPEPLDGTLNNLITSFEADIGNGPQGMVGFHAKNIGSNQSIGYRATEPMYLASCSKTPMHILLWDMVEDDPTILTDNFQYTLNVNTRNPWYTDNRDPASQGNALGPNDFGLSFSVQTLDSFMIVQSDNSATSMILEQVLGRGELNKWLAGIEDVGRGFHPLTSIIDLDRVIMWQGQVTAFPSAESYFRIPSWYWEPFFRTGGNDVFGDLQAYVGPGNPFPGVDMQVGHERYFRMGLNSAEPRAFSRLLEKFLDGDFIQDPTTFSSCLNAFGGSGGTTLEDILDGTVAQGTMPPPPPGEFPNVFCKNGGKGSQVNNVRVVNDTVIMQKEATSIVMGFFSMYNQRNVVNNVDPIRATWIPQFGYQLYSNLISDLKDRGPDFHSLSSSVVSPNSNFSIGCHVRNDRGGDATPYKVRFYASTNASISPAADYLIGTYQTPTNHPGNSNAGVVLNLADFPPNIPFGQNYYLGFVIDEDQEVGEWDDRIAVDNTELLMDTSGSGAPVPYQLMVELSIKAPDIDEDGDLDLKDFAAFQVCHTGSDVPVSRECDWANLDGDGRLDADLDDFVLWVACQSGPTSFVDPECGL